MAQYGVKEVMDFTITNYNPDQLKRKPIISVDYAQVTSIENGGERIPVDGGQGNKRLMNFDHSKSTTVNITLPLVDLNMLALISGDDVMKRIKKIYKREVLPAVDPASPATVATVELAKTPIEGSLFVYQLGGYRDLENQLKPASSSSAVADGEYAIDGTTVSLNATTFKDCREVVVYYQYETSKAVTNLKIDPTKFPKAISFYGDTFMRDQFDEKDKLFHIVGHKGRIQPNYTLNMSGTDVAVLELAVDMYAVKDKCTGEQMYLEYVEDEDNSYEYEEGTHV